MKAKHRFDISGSQCLFGQHYRWPYKTCEQKSQYSHDHTNTNISQLLFFFLRQLLHNYHIISETQDKHSHLSSCSYVIVITINSNGNEL